MHTLSERGFRGINWPDCKYVVDGMRAIAAGTAQNYLDGEDADLWRRAEAAPALVRWVPAHLSAAQAEARGVRRLDWWANSVVDVLANQAAHAAGPPQALVDRRARWRDALATVASLCRLSTGRARSHNEGAAS